MEIASSISNEATQHSYPSKIFQYVLNTAETNSSLLRNEVFDGNAETVIMDNAMQIVLCGDTTMISFLHPTLN